MLFTVDANSGSWQVEVEDIDYNYIPFTFHHRLYKFLRTLSGLKNAPKTSLRAVDAILSLMKWQLAIVYLDRNVVFLRPSRDYINHVRGVFSLSQEVGVIVKLEKVASPQLQSTSLAVPFNRDVLK